MSSSFFLSLREGASAAARGASELTIRDRRVEVRFQDLSPGALAALRRLGDQGAEEDELIASVHHIDGEGAALRFLGRLHALDQNGLLLRSVGAEGVCLATLTPMAAGFEYSSPRVVLAQSYIISRFACLRRDGGSLIVDSPHSRVCILLHDARAAVLVGALAKPATVAELVDRVKSLPPKEVALLLALLLKAGAVEPSLDNRTDPLECDTPALQTWSFHDLLFHSRRSGSHSFDAGRFRPPLRYTPQPHPVSALSWTSLDRPEAERAERDCATFAWVQEQRRSVRDYGTEPITVGQLGEFLYWAVRYEQPLPGVLCPLQVYPVIDICGGLEPGLYHYDSMHHGLAQLCGRTPFVERMLMDAGASIASPKRRLQVLLVLASRKCSAVPYSLILQQVGASFQRMYLVATMMGLAPCALGCGDADAFARAASAEYCSETSVGEFLLGSMA
jgi:SagB-type dehydrogenase family enzyme